MFSGSGFFKRRPLFWLALAVCLGIFIDELLEPQRALLITSAAAFLAACILASFFFRRLIFAAAIVLSVSLGASLHAFQARLLSANDVANLTPERACFVWLRGTILEADWRAKSSALTSGKFARTNWTLSVEALSSDGNVWTPAAGRVRVSAWLNGETDELAALDPLGPLGPSHISAGELAEGDRIQCRARLEPLPAPTLPDAFDYGAFLAAQGVQRMGAVTTSTLQPLSGPRWWELKSWLRRASGALAARTESLLNGDAEQAGLLNAMVFGRRENLSVTDREAFTMSGTAHLLAISGLHIQLVCALVWRLLSYFGYSRRRSALWVLAACAGYCLLTGATPPAVRATVMFATYIAASAFWREADPLTALAAAALIILSYAPQELFNAGFQLSFLAVLSLHTLFPMFKETLAAWNARHGSKLLLAPAAEQQAPSWRTALSEWAVNAMLISLCAWLATAPAVAWHMGRLSTLSLLVNLFALPLLTVCMLAGFVTLTVGYFFSALGKLLGFGASAAYGLLEWINRQCASIPGASIDMPRPSALALVAYAGMLCALWIAHSRRRNVPAPLARESLTAPRLFLYVSSCPLLLLSSLLFRAHPAAAELTIFDLQRGRSALFETPGGAALIDAGAKGQGLRVAEVLRRRGIHSLALLVLTGDDPDAIDGALELLPRVAVQRVIFPRCKFPSETRRALEGFLSQKKIPYASPGAKVEIAALSGMHWEFTDDGPPLTDPAANNSALCVRVECADFSVLFAAAKSNASLARLLSKTDFQWKATILRLVPADFGNWPRETAELIQRAGSTLVAAGTNRDAEAISGVDFEALSARPLSPHREGSLRIRSAAGKLDVSAYRGNWRALE
ncbi:MAG TPA: ComEC/Rec2 family competence protein [Planctomycetota bacterium]|nr:ComEC/Rec2 family competence protein [Planctomycetota bacterium]